MVKKIIHDYISAPRQMRWHVNGKTEFTYERTFIRGKNKRFPESLKGAWMIRYNNEPVIVLATKKDVVKFIKEKLE